MAIKTFTMWMGLDIFNEYYAHLLPDGLHPNTEGYGIMATNIMEALRQF